MEFEHLNNSQDEPLYTRRIAARLARISLDLVDQCEQEKLIHVQVMRGGGQGLSRRDVQRLVRIRRLQEDLGLELPAIEIVLRMRRRMIDLMRQLDEMESIMTRREEELMVEIRNLQRRFAERSNWENQG
jgi:DNA-binding transcriptional MerR regulator